MLQTVKSSFLLLVIFTMSSAVYAADNNGDTKQSETIIHKAGTQVKSTRIYDGVPSQQYMDTQGKSIEEIKGPDMSTQETPADEPLYRGDPISSWSTEDYINVTPQKFHNALRNQTVPSNKSYRPKLTVVQGDETNVEQRTAPISTWGVQGYLNVSPQSKHRAIKEMQKAPVVTPGEEVDVEPRTRPISEFTKEDYLKIAPPSLHDAINNEGGTFTVGSSRSYDEITIIISTDYWYSESSWNLYDSTAGAFYYTTDQTFSSTYETQTVTLELQPGAYAVVAYDAYSDGGMSGTVTDENGIVLTTILLSGASGTYGFTVSPPTYDVTINLSIDYWASEGTWQLFDDASAAVTTLQAFSTGYETQTMILALEGGSYTLITYDSYSDGGITGTVSDADGNTLAIVNHTTGASQSWPFAIGLYDVTVTLEADYWYSESTWNLYGPYNDTTASAYYYSSHQTFTAAYETQTTVFSLAAGDYSVDIWDAYSDGGVSGSVVDADGNLLVTVASTYGSFGSYMFEVVVPEPVLAGLFFSEYIEGSSYNKALELYNPTEDTLDLANYRIAQATNGGGFGTYYHSFPTGATLPPGEVWTIVHSSTNDTIFNTSNANELQTYVVNGNGDDARGLETTHDGGTTWTLIDVIGDPDNDPGTAWEVAGVNNATKDHTLIRKPLITMGNIDWTESAGTHADTSEWIVFDQNYFTNLGGHPGDPCWGAAVTFTFYTGSYGGEVQYYITNAAGDTLISCFGCMASSQTYATDLCLDDGVYTVWGRDNYGDSWNGGYYDITDADSNIVTTGTGPPNEGYGNTPWYQYPFGINVAVAAFTSAEFDGVVLNDSETTAAVVTNGGYSSPGGAGAILVVDSVATATGSYSVSSAGLPDTLASGESFSAQVTFNPTSAGDNDAYVVFYHDATSSPDSVMVSGFGVDAYFYEGFGPHTGSYTELPMDDWTIVDGNADADSIPQRYKTWYHDNYSSSGGNMTVYNGYNNSYWADETMITPLIQTPDLAKLTIKTYDYYEYLDVDYSVDGTNFMELASVYLSGSWQQHDISLPDVDSLWVSFTYAPDSGYSTTTYLNLDEVKVTAMPNTYLDGWVEDQDTDLGVGGVSVVLNGTELTTTGENELFLHPGFEDSSFVSTYYTPTASDWWVYGGADASGSEINPTTLTNFAHMTDGDLVYVDTTEALGANELSVHEGDKALKMWGQYSGIENYTAIYKQIGAVSEGQEMYVGAWAMSHSDGPLTGGTAFFVAINWLASDFSFLGQDQSEWLDSTYIVHSDLDWNEWHYMDVHGVAPAGVAYVQLQLTFYQPIGYATGSVYVDAAQATMHPGHYNYRGMDEGDYSVMFSHDDYNSASFAGVGIEDDVADTTRLDAGLAPLNMTEFEAGFEADQDSGSTVITSGSASFMVMDTLSLSVVDSTVFTDTTSTGADTTWTVYDTTEYNVGPYMGDGMLVYPGGGVYEDSAYAMWVSGEPIDITDYMAEGGNLSMNYRRNMNVAPGDTFYVGVMLDDSTVWWGDYNRHTGSTYGGWYSASADLSWLRELDNDSSTTATPVIIFESNDSLVVGWGGAFDEFHVTGNPWFLPLPGHLHAESFGSYVPLQWDEPMSSGRVSYELHSFNMSELGGLQPPTIQTRTITSNYDNSAIPRDAISYSLERRHWDGSTRHIGEWAPLAVTSMTSYLDFDVSEGDRADYRMKVRFEGGDNNTYSNKTHARVGVPYVMLVDSFATATFDDSTFGEHWEIWSTDSTGATSWVIGDSASASSATGAMASYLDIPEHPDSAGTFAYINNGQAQGTTVLMTPFLDFRGHKSALLEFEAFAMTYYDFYAEDYAYGDWAAVYVKAGSQEPHLAVAPNYRHTAGWATERANVGSIVGDMDRVQVSVVWKHGTGTYFQGDGFAIDDLSIKPIDGPDNLTAEATTTDVTLNWSSGGRSIPLDPNWIPPTEEEKRAFLEASSPSVNDHEDIVSDELSFAEKHEILSSENTFSSARWARQGGETFADAVPITIPYSGSGTTVGYVNDYGPIANTGLSCPWLNYYDATTTFLGPDVVYSLTLLDTTVVSVSLLGSSYDTGLGIYDASDSSLVLGNDDYNSLQSYVECELDTGTYYIVVDGWGSGSGAYVIEVNEIIPPDIGAQTFNVWKDGNHVASEIPDSVSVYVDENVNLMESCYTVNASELMWVSREWEQSGSLEHLLVSEWVETDHSNEVCAAMVNTPPSAFALVTPPDGEELVITHDNIASAQIFAWSSSADPNGSVVTYHAALQVSTGTDTLEISVDTTGTAVIVPYASIADVMTIYATATGNYTADVSWTVYADDGWDVVQASNGPRSISVDIGWYLGTNDEAIVPDVFALHQNYPNPFNPVTTIRYDIPEQALVRIDIYNILGQKVAVLAEGFHEPGFHAVTWNGTNMYGNALSSGMYFYHIKAGDFRNVKKLLLVK